MSDSWHIEWYHAPRKFTGFEWEITGPGEWRRDETVSDWPLEKIIAYMAFFKRSYDLPMSNRASNEYLQVRVVNNETGEIIPGEILE